MCIVQLLMLRFLFFVFWFIYLFNLGEQFDLSSQNDEFLDEDGDDSSSIDNSEFITIHVTNEAGESKEIDHIKDKEHHAPAGTQKGPNEPHHVPGATKLNQPSTSAQNKYDLLSLSSFPPIFISS